jgi:hypothetical protein
LIVELNHQLAFEVVSIIVFNEGYYFSS